MNPLRIALVACLSTYCVNTYEDVLGLHRAGRSADALPLAGELAQRAALLDLLQTALVEPASKWALTIARDDPHLGLAERARDMLAHLAAGMLQRESADAALALTAPPPSDGLCVMGAPGYAAVLDLDRSEVAVCNRAFLERYLGPREPSRQSRLL